LLEIQAGGIGQRCLSAQPICGEANREDKNPGESKLQSALPYRGGRDSTNLEAA